MGKDGFEYVDLEANIDIVEIGAWSFCPRDEKLLGDNGRITAPGAQLQNMLSRLHYRGA
jgi:hypothetical protein